MKGADADADVVEFTPESFRLFTPSTCLHKQRCAGGGGGEKVLVSESHADMTAAVLHEWSDNINDDNAGKTLITPADNDTTRDYYCNGFFFISKFRKLENMSSKVSSLCIDRIAKGEEFDVDVSQNGEALEDLRRGMLRKLLAQSSLSSSLSSVSLGKEEKSETETKAGGDDGSGLKGECDIGENVKGEMAEAGRDTDTDTDVLASFSTSSSTSTHGHVHVDTCKSTLASSTTVLMTDDSNICTSACIFSTCDVLDLYRKSHLCNQIYIVA